MLCATSISLTACQKPHSTVLAEQGESSVTTSTTATSDTTTTTETTIQTSPSTSTTSASEDTREEAEDTSIDSTEPTPDWDGESLFWSYFKHNDTIYASSGHSSFANAYLDMPDSYIENTENGTEVETFIEANQLKLLGEIKVVDNANIPAVPFQAVNLPLKTRLYQSHQNDGIYVRPPINGNEKDYLHLYMPFDLNIAEEDIYYKEISHTTAPSQK